LLIFLKISDCWSKNADFWPMRMFIAAAIVCLAFNLHAQSQPNPEFKKVDDFKLNDSKVKVFFKDPLAVLVTSLPDFESKPDPQKNKLLEVYLQNHEIYLFSVTSKEGRVTSYVMRGDPEKKEAANYYQVEITDGDVQDKSKETHPRKQIKNIGIGGEFFEHMAAFQLPQFKKVTTTRVWGNIVHINRYAPIKEALIKIIQDDQQPGQKL
jgi:hypothetical protein